MNQFEADMYSKCLEVSQALVSKGQPFNFSFTIGIHSFSLDTRESTTKVVDRKRLSPSQLRRNLKRKEDFLKKKSDSPNSSKEPPEQTPEKETEADVVPVNQHKCSICERTFATKNGLNIHKGKAHDQQALRTSSLKEPPLEPSPIKDTPREEQCVCCGYQMSPHHQCEPPHQPEAHIPKFSFGGPAKGAPPQPQYEPPHKPVAHPPAFSFGGPAKEATHPWASQPTKCNCFPPFCTHNKR